MTMDEKIFKRYWRRKQLVAFLKREVVLLVSFMLAVASAFVVRPSREYVSYIDWRTLSLLFCLMAILGGVSQTGLLQRAAGVLLRKVHTARGLSLVLVVLCFAGSMVMTNDVALMTFVPFTLLTLELCGRQEQKIPLVVLETIAANLGSMATPFGNPQNLYLFSRYGFTVGEFAAVVVPYGVLSLALLLACCCLLKGGGQPVKAIPSEEAHAFRPRWTLLYSGLFLLALLTVFRVIPYGVTLGIVAAVLLLCDRRVLLQVDYSLLLTFLFLFIFIGNLGKNPAVDEFLQNVVRGHEVVVGIAASQVFSNVPAAILLSGFTENAAGLLVGVNLGGLGTLIASMASLISFKYIAGQQVSKAAYIGWFTLANIGFLVANGLLCVVLELVG